MKISTIFLSLAAAAALSAADLKQGDQFYSQGDYKSAIRCYNEAYYSSQSPRERIAGGLKRVITLRKMGFYEIAGESAKDITKDPQALPEEKIQAALLSIAIHTNELSNINAAKQATDILVKYRKQLTPEQRELARNTIKDCERRRKTFDLTPEEQKVIAPLKAKIRKDHPRLFFNKETLPLVIKHNQRPDIRAYFQKNVRKCAEKAPDDPQLWTGEKGQARRPGRSGFHTVERPNFYGTEAAACALVYLIDGDQKFLDKAIRLLEISAQAVPETYKIGVLANGEYYGRTYLYALCAWDWLWHDMTPEQRQRIGKGLLEYAARIEKEGEIFRGFWSQPESSGFYTIRMSKWYAGITFTGSGLDETATDYLLYAGHKDHEVMLQARDQITGDDGGIVSTANNYLMATYLWSTYNYLASWEAAFGENRAKDVRHLHYFPQWCIWSLINGTEREWTENGKTTRSYRYDFGNGDTENVTKEAVKADLYLYEILHFFPDDPQMQKMVMNCITSDPLNPPVWPNLKYRPLTPVIRYNLPPLPAKYGKPEISLKDHARYFENLGIAFMRSGSSSTDTYAAFVSGKLSPQHRHFDANSFSIYKHDFLALDTGTRFGVQNNDYEHLNTYYAQSVAHNTILIHMPEEDLPEYWWKHRNPRQYFSHGGQSRSFGDRTMAYETNDHFTYIAGDAAPVFSKEKCKLAMRQFVFLYPDFFVIADRVTSTKPEYRKEWIIHSQNEPVMINDTTFRFDDGGGRLFCKTLLPAALKRTVVGGEGKEFFASGKNWELPPAAKKYAKQKNYLGRYRTEITSSEDNASEYFLHVIQVGADSVPQMVPAKLLETDDSFGAEIVTDQGTWQITFAKSGDAAGHVKLVQDGKVKIDRPLRNDIQPQTGLQ